MIFYRPLIYNIIKGATIYTKYMHIFRYAYCTNNCRCYSTEIMLCEYIL